MAIKNTSERYAEAPGNPEDLSVALELKFLVPFLPRDAVHPQHHDGPQLDVFTDISTVRDLSPEEKTKLRKVAYSRVAKTISAISGQIALTSYDLGALNMQERDCWSNRWVVKNSNSAEPAKDHPHRYDWLWVPIEINSPKLRWKDPRSLEVITAVMNNIRARHYVVSNYSCEVHIHVGRMDGCSFSLPSLKRIAMLCWVAEPVLRKVKDPQSPNFEHTYTWSSAARQHSRLAADLGAGQMAHTPRTEDLVGLPSLLQRYLSEPSIMARKEIDALRFIAGTRTHVQLGRLMSGEGRPYRRLGFNFSAFGGEDERARTNPRTVECRFLEGTMDTDVVVGWLQIFGMLVEVALVATADDRRFSRLIIMEDTRKKNDVRLHERPFIRLMRRFQLSERAYFPVQKMMHEIHGRQDDKRRICSEELTAVVESIHSRQVKGCALTHQHVHCFAGNNDITTGNKCIQLNPIISFTSMAR